MLFNLIILLTSMLLMMNSSVIQKLHRSETALHSILCSAAVVPPLAGTKGREKENKGRGSEMSHSCRHISSHKHQLLFFRGKKRSFETKPGVSVDRTFNTSPLCFHAHLPKQPEKIFSLLAYDCWHVLNTQDFPFGWCFLVLLDRRYTLNTNNSVHVLIYSSLGQASLHMFVNLSQ